MTPHDLCQIYLDALNRADLGAVRALFAPGAMIVSPLYGTRPAHDFYAELFADTAASQTTLLDVFDRSASGRAVALHFRYVWTLATGKVVTFDCVDVFDLAPDGQRFAGMTILYDTAPLRAEFEAAQSRS
jgi:hypothetical protein